MIQLLRLIQNENTKLYKRKMLWVMVALLIATIALSMVITLKTADKHPADWQDQVRKEIKTNQAEIKAKNVPEQLKDADREQIKIDNYRLAHHVAPMYDNTALGFVKSTLDYSGIITLFLIIIAASTVAQEYSWGTLKLVLMRPVKRWKVLVAKYLSVLFNGLLLFIFLMVFSFIVGVIAFGFKDTSLHYVYMQQGKIHDVSIFTHFLAYGSSEFFGMIMICAFALMISTLLKSSALAIALSIVIEFAGSIISSLLALWGQNYAKYLFFNNTNLYQYVEGEPLSKGMTVGFSLSVLAVYFILFMAVSLFVFEKRDITS